MMLVFAIENIKETVEIEVEKKASTALDGSPNQSQDQQFHSLVHAHKKSK